MECTSQKKLEGSILFKRKFDSFQSKTILKIIIESVKKYVTTHHSLCLEDDLTDIYGPWSSEAVRCQLKHVLFQVSKGRGWWVFLRTL